MTTVEKIVPMTRKEKSRWNYINARSRRNSTGGDLRGNAEAVNED